MIRSKCTRSWLINTTAARVNLYLEKQQNSKTKGHSLKLVNTRFHYDFRKIFLCTNNCEYLEYSLPEIVVGLSVSADTTYTFAWRLKTINFGCTKNGYIRPIWVYSTSQCTNINIFTKGHILFPLPTWGIYFVLFEYHEINKIKYQVFCRWHERLDVCRHGSGISSTNIIWELWLSVHVLRRTVPQLRGELGERDRSVWEMGLLCSQLHRRCLRCEH